MPFRAELQPDRSRGPGHAVLRLTGLPAGGPTLKIALQRSQGAATYLGSDRTWQAAETWHAATGTPAGDAVLVQLGPDLVDPIVEQGSAVTFRLRVRCGSVHDATTLRVQRPLLGSQAAAPPPAPPPEPAPPAPAPGGTAPEGAAAPRAAERPADALSTSPPAPPDASQGPPRARQRSALAVALLATSAFALLLAFAVTARQRCWLPALGGAACPEAAPAPDAAGSGDGGSRIPPTCAGLDGPACLEAARAARTAGELERARELLQQASRLGAVAATVDLARFYDPATWSARTSPVPQPDWETAVYWYELAAQHRDAEGHLGAGRLLCEFGTRPVERERGLAHLRAAAAAGSAEAAGLARACEREASP